MESFLLWNLSNSEVMDPLKALKVESNLAGLVFWDWSGRTDTKHIIMISLAINRFRKCRSDLMMLVLFNYYCSLDFLIPDKPFIGTGL